MHMDTIKLALKLNHVFIRFSSMTGFYKSLDYDHTHKYNKNDVHEQAMNMTKNNSHNDQDDYYTTTANTTTMTKMITRKSRLGLN